jgi:hypothetical protein
MPSLVESSRRAMTARSFSLSLKRNSYLQSNTPTGYHGNTLEWEGPTDHFAQDRM